MDAPSRPADLRRPHHRGPQLPIGTPNSEQLGFSHDDGSPGTSGGSALTPHVVQIGETSASSVSSHRSLMASVSLPSQRFVCLVLGVDSTTFRRIVQRLTYDGQVGSHCCLVRSPPR